MAESDVHGGFAILIAPKQMSVDDSTKSSRIDVLVQENRSSGRSCVLKTSTEDASLHSSGTSVRLGT